MAKRGRKPKPPELKILTGTARGEVAPPTSAVGEAGIPDKPLMVEGDHVASLEWDRVVAILSARGVLSPGDGGILAAYCNAYSRLHKAWALCDSLEVNTRDGAAVKPNPAAAIASQASKDLTRAAAELGLTPSARGRVSSVPGASVDSFEAFINEG